MFFLGGDEDQGCKDQGRFLCEGEAGTRVIRPFNGISRVKSIYLSEFGGLDGGYIKGTGYRVSTDLTA